MKFTDIIQNKSVVVITTNAELTSFIKKIATYGFQFDNFAIVALNKYLSVNTNIGAVINPQGICFGDVRQYRYSGCQMVKFASIKF